MFTNLNENTTYSFRVIYNNGNRCTFGSARPSNIVALASSTYYGNREGIASGIASIECLSEPSEVAYNVPVIV